MSKELDDALEHLTSTYQSLAQAAMGYREILDAKEVNARLAKATPDTAEYVALSQLSFLLEDKAKQKVAPKVEQPTESTE